MDTETLLRRTDPALRTEVPEADSPEGRQIQEDVLSGRPGLGPDRHVPLPKTVGISVGAVVAVAAAVMLLVVLLPASVGPLGSKASAALTRLADQAATVPTNLRAGQYAYTETEGPVMTSTGSATPGGTPYTEYLIGTVQTWVGADGSGRRVTTIDPTPHFYTSTDRSDWVAAGSPGAVIPPGQLTTVQTFAANTAQEVNGPIPLYDVGGLPTDPTALSQILDNENPGAQSAGTLPAGIKSLDFESSCTTADCTFFERTVSLLQGPDIGATPALREALFKVLASVPGVELLGTTTDQAGQSGVGLALVQKQPAQTVKVTCADGPNGIVAYGTGNVELPANPQDTTVTQTTTQYFPASSTTFSIVVDPQTTTLLSTEESYSPIVQAISQPCTSPPGSAQKTERGEHGPSWDDIVSSGVVSSDSSLPG
jgi:hypothetical protein